MHCCPTKMTTQHFVSQPRRYELLRNQHCPEIPTPQKYYSRKTSKHPTKGNKF